MHQFQKYCLLRRFGCATWNSNLESHLFFTILWKLEIGPLETDSLSNKCQNLLSVFKSLKYIHCLWSMGIRNEKVKLSLIYCCWHHSTVIEKQGLITLIHKLIKYYYSRQFRWDLCLIMLKQFVFISCLIYASAGRFFTKSTNLEKFFN